MIGTNLKCLVAQNAYSKDVIYTLCTYVCIWWASLGHKMQCPTGEVNEPTRGAYQEAHQSTARALQQTNSSFLLQTCSVYSSVLEPYQFCISQQN